MATVTEESSQSQADGKPNLSQSYLLDEATPWIDYAVQQAKMTQIAVQEAIDSFMYASRSRLTRFTETGSAHFHQTVDSLRDLKLEYDAYEDLVFRKIKEGVLIASEHPLITCGVAGGLGVVALKRPRRFLYYGTMRLLMNEESMVARADSKVKALKQSFDLLKAEGEKLEKRAMQAEEEIRRGQTKLRQAGKQIQGVIRSAYKIERRAAGLKDICGELPNREASRFISQVSKLASEAKREKNALTKEVTKISNYGISV
uniref:Uncharacterized protein n=1 Tax=Kalanchoe fedtschenkoi TaxID=63787 RepID=A0A7N0SZ23_KALFE